ncbi:2,3-dihydro-2,3-dihydroxybenzoate dehydrogenase [Chitinibacteraceae bacterium HSL-7]
MPDTRIALVTGAASGIGAAVARRLREEGYVVAALDLTPPAAPDDIHFYRADVSQRNEVIRVVEQVESELGPISHLAHVAGILRPGSVCALSESDWLETFSVNTTGAFNVLQSVAIRMSQRRQGAIVLVGSNAADTPRTGMAAYAASKAAAHQFARCLALELAPAGVRCNIVSPGSTLTAMQRQLWQSNDDSAQVIAGNLSQFRLGIPLGRLAEPDDIANAVTYLLSDQARHITLHDLRVDGGATF